MARRSSTKIIRMPAARAAAPIINVRAPSAPRKSKTRRRRSSSRGEGGLSQKSMLSAALGGAGFGFVEKTFPDLPTIPILGKAGTIAVACYLLRGKFGGGGLVRDIGLAAAAVAGYQLAKDGEISGDVVPQVRGVAAQV